MSSVKTWYTEAELPQRSPEWLKMRENVVGASELACVLGIIEKWEKPKTLWKRKTGKLQAKKSNKSMENGERLEEEATKILTEELGGFFNEVKLERFFAYHKDYPHLACSFDGVDVENKFIAEIKCPEKPWNFRSMIEDGIQDYYYPQVQMQLCIANQIWGIDKAIFFAYYPHGLYVMNEDYYETLKKTHSIGIEYNAEYCEKMIKVANKFWEFVEAKTWDQAEYMKVLGEFRGVDA